MKTALAKGGYPVTDVITAHTDVTPDEAKNLMDTDSNLIILDVREPDEFLPDHISGAVNYPWNSGVLTKEYGKLSAGSSVLVVCGSGKRSNLAADFLVSVGFINVYDMTGGMGNMDVPVNYMNIGHIGNDLKFGISCAQYRGTQYRFVLNRSSDALRWRMDSSSFEQIRVPGTCLSVGDDLKFKLTGEYAGITYSFVMNYAMNPQDVLLWKIDAVTPITVH